MTASRSYYLRTIQYLTQEAQVSERLCSNVYRYSYNLGIQEFRARWKRNKTSYSIKPCAESKSENVSESVKKSLIEMRICRHDFAGNIISASKFRNLDSAETNTLSGAEKQAQWSSTKEEISSRKESLSSHNFYQEIYVNGACSQKDYSALQTEQVEAKTSLQEYVSVAEINNIPKFYDRDNACGDKCDILPSFEKFFRAARVLGVCLPSKELYSNVQRRLSGVCEGHSSDNCVQTQSNLLRVLNKRF